MNIEKKHKLAKEYLSSAQDLFKTSLRMEDILKEV